jgi:hypothetical protein
VDSGTFWFQDLFPICLGLAVQKLSQLLLPEAQSPCLGADRRLGPLVVGRGHL